MNPFPAVPPAPRRAPALAVAALLAALTSGCTTTTEGLFGSKVDYRSGAGKTAPLEVPPDLSQLARESRYQPQGGVVSAAASTGPRGPAAVQTGAPSVALDRSGGLRIERQGNARWLVASQPPEQLWPQIKAFWTARGFALAIDDPAVGVMETDWAENRSKLPDDFIRSTIGKLLPNLFDTGLRDRFRTRVDRTATGSEIYISHRGLSEEFTNPQRDGTAWRTRPGDAELEAEFLSRLMIALGSTEDGAKTAVAAAASAPEGAARARSLAGQPAPALEVDEPFDRAWRRVGLALDRSGFTVEDRDRANGLYYVRYVDPANAGKEEPNWFMRLFFGSDPNPQAAQRYRVAVKGSGDKTVVTVLTFAGAPETGPNGQRIVTLLVGELR